VVLIPYGKTERYREEKTLQLGLEDQEEDSNILQLCVSQFFVAVTNIQKKQLKRREGLLWFSFRSSHPWSLAPLL
jgi:hypothetical protein